MGVSGNRNYGGGQKVLPDDRNVCTVGPMKLGRKFIVKKLFYQGKHTELDEVAMFEAKKLIVDFPHPILFQYDGEVLQLNREDLPVTMSVLEPSISVLRAESLF
jgi:diacylglycerol kinase family enzyme